jgi:hypothetical protein
MIQIKRYSSDMTNTWNAFVAAGKNTSFLFDRGFMDYHADRFQDFSLVATNEKGQWIGALPANQSGPREVISHQGLSYGGLITHRTEKLVPTLCIFRAMLQYLHAAGIEQLRYKAIPDFYNEVPADEYRYALFLLKAEWYRCDTALAILPDHKVKIKPPQQPVHFEEASDFSDFWNNVLSPNLQRRYGVKPVHSLSEINLLKSRFPQQIRQFNALIEGELVAGITLFETPRVAHAQYIAASEKGKETSALKHLVQWMLNGPFRNKPVFDLGICNENEGYTLNHGLLYWKEHLGGRSYTHNFYRIETANYSLLDAFCDKA